MRRLAAVLLALLLPLTAQGASATVQRFEAKAHAQPNRAAAVLQVFAEGALLSVSEEVTAGWRRVRLADGGVAWIEDAAVRLGPVQVPAPAPGPLVPQLAPPPPPPAPAAPPDLRARILVKDLDHLAELMKEDPASAAAAAAMIRRRNGAYAVGGVGFAASVVLSAIGASKLSCHSDLNDPRFGQSCGAGGYFVAGGITAAVAVLAAGIMHPTRSDVFDLLNGWNVRHPDEPFTAGGGMGLPW